MGESRNIVDRESVANEAMAAAEEAVKLALIAYNLAMEMKSGLH